MRRLIVLALHFLAFSFVCFAATANAQYIEYTTRDILSNKNIPWEIKWGKDGWIWYTERIGRMGRVNPETLEDHTILVAPTAYHRLAHPVGECATARAAAACGSLYCASTLATTLLEDVAAAAPGAPQWFQLYVHKDRAFTASLIERHFLEASS